MTDATSSKSTNPVIAVVGNPNTGKSALFNNLTGLRQKTANYPGVTVERHTGLLKLESGPITLVDLPGAYSLAAYSPDEMVSADVLLGRINDMPLPSAVLIVIDAANLRRNLFMATQVLELGIPTVVALNMVDLATKRGISINPELLGEKLAAKVVPIVANSGKGTAELKKALAKALKESPTERPGLIPEIRTAGRTLVDKLNGTDTTLTLFEAERALIDKDGAAEERLLNLAGDEARQMLTRSRDKLSSNGTVAALEARTRYAWIDKTVQAIETRQASKQLLTDTLDKITSHPLIGLILFFAVMATVFQAVFSWAGPIMDFIDNLTAIIGSQLSSTMPEGALRSLLVDGVVAGVGSVIIFLPQIIILFAFIIFLEDSGYMARAAFLMDRVMRSCGLSGQSFIPMLSSFACAVPGIMATRVIPNPRDRLVTMLAAPFMTCSARLPVYALLIAAFIPDTTLLGFLNTQGLVLFGLYLLGIFGGIFTALIMKRFALKGPTPTFLIELPPYRLPNFKSMGIRLLDRGQVFLYRAGTVIFTVALVVWALVYFPRPETVFAEFDSQRIEAIATLSDSALDDRLAEIDRTESATLLEQSYLGRMGKTIQPVFAPLGWDWKITAGVIASFPAREVVVAVLGTIYSVGGDVDETDPRLLQRLQNATNTDGTPVFTTGVAVGLMIFFAFCLQCMATVGIMRRETNGWKWPISAWCYMTSMGYIGALLAYQLI
ncbi:MAG: ferrous iron transport protein B [Gammaproteobacteria bacterium]|nr:ferrous iron transport protein B [Gammaproteobacteria bacterium]MCP4088924.1 ferrous iron transport protein B [Gammaproteobacteria bacterium]MCP4274940.1 ferrous iron transport protein B [Gammaproteobacteria bacterium]MCP4831993.1 ferrous iron transport protein B [Gammaproteobacteria bacterium]MCP4929428.1 ferrous iron transport protein B [Gammaproteobacteria bacterium]